MAIVTGDRYLDFLVKFVDKQAGPLLEGALVLKLNPVGLHYVQSRLEALQELEGLLSGAPVDYLRAYISDLGDHRALEQLRRILRLLTSLKVVSVFPPPARDPTPLSLLPFGRLKVLELRGCDLSTSAARGLLELRHTLEKIICYNSTDALRHVFASRIVDIKDSPVWNRLSFISCACNGLVLMDESLQLLPAVETLDLSRNKFGKVDNLRKCTKLKHLDLGFNHLRSVCSFNEVAASIVKLVLRSNALTTLRGIENLKSVEGLDLSYNIISNLSELEILASLPSLQSLWLEGNPICCTRWYRAQVFSLFTDPEKLKLDEREITTRESWKRQIILASRQRRPAGFGFYSPAKDNADKDGSDNTKQKRLSRLALIEGQEQRRHFIIEAIDQEPDSCDSEIRSREGSAVSDGEAEIVNLMNRVEFMKKERSVLWLREFKEWMDQTALDNNMFPGSIGPGEEKCTKKISRKHFKKSTRYMPDSLHASGDENSTNFVKPDNSPPHTFSAMHSYQSFNSTSEAASDSSIVESSRGSRPHLDVGESGVKQMPLKALGKEFFLPDTVTLEGGDLTDAQADIMAGTVIDEIMGSRSSSAYPGSPPHYQEDILHRRQNLEEEFMQLSAESFSLASSDSDTSCSDEDVCKSEASLPDIYGFFNKEFSDKIMDGHSEDLLFDGSYSGKRHESFLTRQNGISSVSSCADQPSKVEGVLPPDHSCMDDVLVSAACCDSDDATNEDTGCLEKRKGKRRLKRRIVTLSDDKHSLRYAEPLSQKQNGIAGVGKADIEDEHEGQTSGVSDHVNISVGDCNDSSIIMEATSHLTTDGSIKKYFEANVADSSISEIYLRGMLCDCLIEKEPECRESEVAILLSNRDKFYVLIMDTGSDASGTISKVMGCHRLEEIKEVVIGIGLQVLSVQVEMDSVYIFITKTIEKSRELLSLLRVCDSSPLNSRCSLKSLEQGQVKLFEEHVCGGLKMSIFLYSMLLFWCNSSEEKSWLSRSLFVIEGYMLVCVEDLVHFSSVPSDDAKPSQYFMLDSCCSISSISEMVIEPKESKCLTLTLNCAPSKKFKPCDDVEKQVLATKLEEKMVIGSNTWKFKWFSEETLVKFVALLKALHAATAISPLLVRRIS